MKTCINKISCNSSGTEAHKESESKYYSQDVQDLQVPTMTSKLKPNSPDLSNLWIGISLTSICAFTALTFAVIQNEVVFFEDVAWENEDSISLARAYTIAFMTAILSLFTSSYGFWRQYLPSGLMSTFDELTASLLTANGAMCFCSFMMFMSLEVFQDDFEEGTRGVFVFAISCFILSILFTTVNFKTLGTSTQSQVDGRTLI